jgi:hypothetical protein
MLVMNRLEFSCFADFYERIFRTREEYGFFLNPLLEGSVNSIEQNSSLLLNRCSRIPFRYSYPYVWRCTCLEDKRIQGDKQTDADEFSIIIGSKWVPRDY